MEDWYRIKNIEDLDTPALVVYPERVKQNIARAISIIGAVGRLRPHVKTHKSKEVTRLLLDAGITKFKCATIAEAEVLGMVQAPDVLLAYQPVGPKIKRFIELIKTYPRTDFSCLTDNEAAATAIDEAAKAAGINIPVYIDVNVGMNRTGVLPERAADLYTCIAAMNHLTMRGLHAYDGHIHAASFEVRKQQSDTAFAAVEAVKKKLMDLGMTEPVLIIGGSPTFPIHAKRKKVECSPGTFVYWDYGYGTKFPEQQFLPAALVISRVISLPDATTVCTDLGHKSIAAENALNNRVYFINAPDIVVEGQSEEHLKLNAGEGHSFKIGEVLYGMPVHVCPTVALYEKALLVENGIVGNEWRTIARDRKITL